MSEDGSTKDDVKLPDGEVGDKINKLFKEDEKDTSESKYNAPHEKQLTDQSARRYCLDCHGRGIGYGCQGSSTWLKEIRYISQRPFRPPFTSLT